MSSFADSVQRIASHFACPGVEFFVRGQQVGLRVTNQAAEAVIYAQGAQVAEYRRHGQPPLLWMSGHGDYGLGRPLRGGVPVCWPWFGDADRNPPAVRDGLRGDALPAHGFVRQRPWELEEVRALADDLTLVAFTLRDDADTRALFPHAFELRLIVLVGDTLEISLRVANSGEEAFTCTGALHTYLAVSDITQCTVRGLEDVPYVDALEDWQRRQSPDSLRVDREVDRLYLGEAIPLTLEDAGQPRRVTVAQPGATACVAWNPWTEKALRLSDFGAEDYHRMLCLESAWALDGAVTIAPGEEKRLTLVLGEAPLTP